MWKKIPEEYLLKICCMGIPTELKTKMLRAFAEGKFTTNYLPTLGVDITTKQIRVDSNNIKLILVDTAGQEFFGKLQPSYYRGASAAIIIFDMGDRNSYTAVKKLYKEFCAYIPQVLVPIALVGFKSKVYVPIFLRIRKILKKIGMWIGWGNIEEITKDITTDEGQSLAEELQASYYEIKPTDKATIELIFHDLTCKVLKKRFRVPPINRIRANFLKK